jgi:hypothetical protein
MCLDARTSWDGMGWLQDQGCLVGSSTGTRTSQLQIFRVDVGRPVPKNFLDRDSPRVGRAHDEEEEVGDKHRRGRRGDAPSVATWESFAHRPAHASCACRRREGELWPRRRVDDLRPHQCAGKLWQRHRADELQPSYARGELWGWPYLCRERRLGAPRSGSLGWL